MHKRFRKALEASKIFDSSSDEAPVNIRKNRLVATKKYLPRRRENTPPHISDTSSDEATTSNKMGQENRKWLPHLKRYSSDPKLLASTPKHKYQPLPLSVNGKSPSLSSSAELLNIPKSAPPAKAARHSFGSLLTAINRYRQWAAWNGSKQEESMDDALMDRSLPISIEANLKSMVDSQLTPTHSRKVSTGPNKKRCIKGGLVHEYRRQVLRERMDRRSLAQNQRLGLSSGQRVRVLSKSESFGVTKARVQVMTEGQQNKAIFHMIIPHSMASSIRVGSNLELYFAMKEDSALKLPNKELVYVHPNKIVLL